MKKGAIPEEWKREWATPNKPPQMAPPKPKDQDDQGTTFTAFLVSKTPIKKDGLVKGFKLNFFDWERGAFVTDVAIWDPEACSDMAHLDQVRVHQYRQSSSSKTPGSTNKVCARVEIIRTCWEVFNDTDFLAKQVLQDRPFIITSRDLEGNGIYTKVHWPEMVTYNNGTGQIYKVKFVHVTWVPGDEDAGKRAPTPHEFLLTMWNSSELLAADHVSMDHWTHLMPTARIPFMALVSIKGTSKWSGGAYELESHAMRSNLRQYLEESCVLVSHELVQEHVRGEALVWPDRPDKIVNLTAHGMVPSLTTFWAMTAPRYNDEEALRTAMNEALSGPVLFFGADSAKKMKK